MRRWLFVLLVVLLPLRGWVGGAMAGEMLARHVAAAQAASQPASQATHAQAPAAAAHAAHHAAAAVPPHDCAGHGHAHPPAHERTAAKAHAPQLPDPGCVTCASCQACSSVALGVALPALPLVAFGHATPRAVPPLFASAEPRLGDKPPRS
jgi:hypothetical protein